ncbi:DUF2635 domain-containing protein [Azospirillum sp. TSH64]|uniref:DUF2635 domain-containing protein n=1 Tax=Azospirillum sp. TSH64 TaxID=652740 RepID=UPI000D60B6A0|nr:DUF2635 domain-containing protein [Azospirillum sp. TSH64]PWC74056.1 hypothetical protein TSH64_02625 [Azospirillum sp. TSH64]
MFVKPKPGLQIRDPDLRDFLPDAGRDVPETPYWTRLLNVFGDVVPADQTAAPPPVAEEA